MLKTFIILNTTKLVKIPNKIKIKTTISNSKKIITIFTDLSHVVNTMNKCKIKIKKYKRLV